MINLFKNYKCPWSLNKQIGCHVAKRHIRINAVCFAMSPVYLFYCENILCVFTYILWGKLHFLQTTKAA